MLKRNLLVSNIPIQSLRLSFLCFFAAGSSFDSALSPLSATNNASYPFDIHVPRNRRLTVTSQATEWYWPFVESVDVMRSVYFSSSELPRREPRNRLPSSQAVTCNQHTRAPIVTLSKECFLAVHARTRALDATHTHTSRQNAGGSFVEAEITHGSHTVQHQGQHVPASESNQDMQTLTHYYSAKSPKSKQWVHQRDAQESSTYSSPPFNDMTTLS